MSCFAETLIEWQQRHGRHGLPWQDTRDPYRIWLSEIMLQQTQVDTVIPYYRRFLARFPDVVVLAAAEQADVLALWSGLGYYARARNLHRAARSIVADHGGAFPRSAAQIAGLPGIGRSTAAAIAAFCFDERAAILDGNVKRVLARHHAIEGFPGRRVVEQALWQIAESLLPATDVGTYTQSLMDLGATVCTRSKPACGICPVIATCLANAQGRQAELPAPRPARVVPERSTRVLVACYGGSVLLERRPEAGIWGGLYALPEIPEGMEAGSFVRTLGLQPNGEPRSMASLRHAFTHFRLTIEPLRCDVAERGMADGRWRWATTDEWPALGLPTPVRKLLDAIEPGDQLF